MKSNIKSTLIALLISGSGIAQDKIVLFQIENQNHLLLEHFTPMTQMEYYSTIQGGKQLDKITTDLNGNARHQFQVESTPAFVLNRLTESNKLGTNKVYFLDQKEFSAKNIEFNVLAGHSSLTWKAQVAFENDISFQVYKHASDGTSKLVKTIQGISGAEWSQYEYTEPFEAMASYSLRIIKDKTILRYTSSNLNEGMSYSIQVYPTIVQDHLFIDLPELTENTPCVYQLSSLSGQLIRKGNFVNLHNQLNVQDLNTGTYILNVHQGIESKSVKFTKAN